MTNSRVCLITGASGGIGEATARALLDAGHRVAVTSRDATRLDALRDAGVLTLTADPVDHEALAAAVASTVERFGRLDAVVANAGFSSHGPYPDADPDLLKEMVLVNVLGPALLVKAALPALKETGGRIVFIGSTAGLRHTPGNMYAVTKWAVHALAENTRLLVGGDGVGVTLVAPGRVDTPFWDGREGGVPPDGPLLTAGQTAEAVVWALAQPPGVDAGTVVVRPIGG